MTEQALKPCPFCGSATAPKVSSYYGSVVRCRAITGGCGSETGRFRDKSEAIAAWNNRA